MNGCWRAGPPPGLDLLLEQEANPDPSPVRNPLHSRQVALHESGLKLERVQHPMLLAEQPSSRHLAAAMPQPAPLVVPSNDGGLFGQTPGPASPTQQDGGSTSDAWLEELRRTTVQHPQFWATAADKELPSDMPGSSRIQQEASDMPGSSNNQQADVHESAVTGQQGRGSKRQASPDEAVPAPEQKRNSSQVVGAEQLLPVIDASPDAYQGPDDAASQWQPVVNHLESTRRRLQAVGSDDGNSCDELDQDQGVAHAQAPQRLHLSTDTAEPFVWGPQPTRIEEFDSLLRLRAYQQDSSNDEADPPCDGMLLTVAMTSA